MRSAPLGAGQTPAAARLAASADQRIPLDLAYDQIAGLSSEMIERLSEARPETISQASRIRGITPAALTAVFVASRRAA
jgi:tRNA uridine 5-carboxymethylaminomethyl modification enzyme